MPNQQKSVVLQFQAIKKKIFSQTFTHARTVSRPLKPLSFSYLRKKKHRNLQWNARLLFLGKTITAWATSHYLLCVICSSACQQMNLWLVVTANDNKSSCPCRPKENPNSFSDCSSCYKFTCIVIICLVGLWCSCQTFMYQWYCLVMSCFICPGLCVVWFFRYD